MVVARHGLAGYGVDRPAEHPYRPAQRRVAGPRPGGELLGVGEVLLFDAAVDGVEDPRLVLEQVLPQRAVGQQVATAPGADDRVVVALQPVLLAHDDQVAELPGPEGGRTADVHPALDDLRPQETVHRARLLAGGQLHAGTGVDRYEVPRRQLVADAPGQRLDAGLDAEQECALVRAEVGRTAVRRPLAALREPQLAHADAAYLTAGQRPHHELVHRSGHAAQQQRPGAQPGQEMPPAPGTFGDREQVDRTALDEPEAVRVVQRQGARGRPVHPLPERREERTLSSTVVRAARHLIPPATARRSGLRSRS